MTATQNSRRTAAVMMVGVFLAYAPLASAEDAADKTQEVTSTFTVTGMT